MPAFTAGFTDAVKKHRQVRKLPLEQGETVEQLIVLTPILWPERDVKKTNQEAGVDLITNFANNYYEGSSRKRSGGFLR